MTTGAVERRGMDPHPFLGAAPTDEGRGAFHRFEARRIVGDLRRLAAAHGRPLASVVDVGCGTGLYAMCAAACGANRVLCVDPDPESLAVARSKLAAAHPDVTVEYLRCDLLQLVRHGPRALAGADLITLGSVLQYVPDWAAAVDGLAAAAPRAAIYVSSTPASPRGGRLEEFLAAADYRLRRSLTAEPARRAHRRETIEAVDPERLSRVLLERGYRVRIERYRTFHTGLGNRAFGWLAGAGLLTGSRFTLAASQQAAARDS